jgi:hypothetical protein
LRLAGGGGWRLNRRAVIFRRLIVRLLLLAAFAGGPLLLAADNPEELQAKAEKGDAEAQFYLGVMYENGNGVLKDYTEAVKWYRKAADQGAAAAQHMKSFSAKRPARQSGSSLSPKKQKRFCVM